jgi:glycosyltransferase involved in cell wall biosynthesis
LLLPSFFEGYSLPVVEAITMGVPVICSDIEVHREVGKSVPDFIDPLDGAGWLRAIKDYARPDSAARAAQLQRIQGWRSPCWARHVAAMLHFIAGLSPRRAVAAPGWPRRAIGDLVKIPV